MLNLRCFFKYKNKPISIKNKPINVQPHPDVLKPFSSPVPLTVTDII